MLTETETGGFRRRGGAENKKSGRVSGRNGRPKLWVSRWWLAGIVVFYGLMAQYSPGASGRFRGASDLLQFPQVVVKGSKGAGADIR